MTMDTQQFAYRALALAIAACIPLSFIGVTVVAVTHDGAAIGQMFDFFKQALTLAIPAGGVLGAFHLWTNNMAPTSPVASPVAPTTGEGTAGA